MGRIQNKDETNSLRSFKLIEYYIGGPPTGTIVRRLDTGRYKEEESMGVSKYRALYNSLAIEDSNYWEELVDKIPYTILSFMYAGGAGSSRFLEVDGLYRIKHRDIKSGLSIEQLLSLSSEDKYAIESVKRDFDGKVFAVGDDIKVEVSGKYDARYSCSSKIGLNFKIESFRIEDEESRVGGLYNAPEGIYIKLKGNSFVVPLHYVQEVEEVKKKVILKSHDNVDIFVGNKLYLVNKTTIQSSEHSITVTEGTLRTSMTLGGYLGFSSEEAAQDYVLEKSQLLSIADIKSTLHSMVSATNGMTVADKKKLFMTALYEVANSKINK